MGCSDCASGNHDACIEKNKDKTTGCPGCCQHRVVKEGVPMGSADEQFSYLTRPMYFMNEIAYMTGMHVRTVRSYTRKDSERFPDRKMLVGNKNNGVYRVMREDLIKFLQELYGG